jgi:argininosuccinate lyase
MTGVKRGNESVAMKLWQKEYRLNKQAEDFTVGDDYILDQKLLKYDVLASIAHAKMLGKIGILKEDEVQKLIIELNNIIQLDKQDKFRILREQEDCHTAIENHLTKELGDLGKKIHTARSRNDQVLTALRLYYKEELND